jgi:hypothetical protein
MAIHKRNGWRDGARAGRLSHRAEVGVAEAKPSSSMRSRDAVSFVCYLILASYCFFRALFFSFATLFTFFPFIRFIFDINWCLYTIAVHVLPSVYVKERENPCTDYNIWYWGILLGLVDSFRFSLRSANFNDHYKDTHECLHPSWEKFAVYRKENCLKPKWHK